MPTSKAAATVPIPTEPRDLRTIMHEMSDMVTIDTSNAILILLNLICVLSEIAIIAPSPASGTMSDGRYKNMPAAINTVLPSISIIRNTMLLGVGINPNKKLENVVKYPNKSKKLADLLKKFDTVLGLKIDEPIVDDKQNEIPEEIIKLAEERKIARENKNWAESDRLRDLIQSKGYSIKDSKDGYELRIIK